MRVLFTHPHFWPHVRRGAEREIHDLGCRLAGRGHEVRLVTSQPGGLTARRRVDGMTTRYVRVPSSRRLEARGWHHEARFGAVAALATAVSRADVVHAFLYADVAFAGRFRVVRRSRPLVLKLTGTVLPERLARTPVDDRLVRGALERADEVWCNSEFARQQMAGFDVPMRVVPAGVDTDWFAPGGARSAEPLAVCTSAPDEPRKRVEDLVTSWGAVREAVPDARLVLAGHATEATRRRLLDEVPAAHRSSVTFAGLLDQAALLDLYRQAWVAVQPSVHEALGLSVLEAHACGTPVVGARSGATTELVDSSGVGGLYPPADPDGAADALVAALAAPPPDASATAARTAATAYRWEAITGLVEARYTALCSGAS